MKMDTRKALDEYYEQAGSWGEDRHAALRRSRTVAWAVASMAALIALVEAFALYQLTPLKTVEPYTILVDKQTGYVQALKPLQASEVQANTALTQSFLVQYVLARESFDIDTLQTNYKKVALSSAETARTQYVAGMQASNPDSMLARLPRSTVVEARVKSVTPMAGNAALVRFDTVQKDGNGRVHAAQPWIATIRYRYSNGPMSIEDRFVNPLGFQVVRYTRSPEALPNETEAVDAADAPPSAQIPSSAPPGPAARSTPAALEPTL